MPAEKAPMRGRLRSSVTAARPWPERMANRHHHRHLLIDGWALPRSAHVKRARKASGFGLWACSCMRLRTRRWKAWLRTRHALRH
jgi:hypothetical protein